MITFPLRMPFFTTSLLKLVEDLEKENIRQTEWRDDWIVKLSSLIQLAEDALLNGNLEAELEFKRKVKNIETFLLEPSDV